MNMRLVLTTSTRSDGRQFRFQITVVTIVLDVSNLGGNIEYSKLENNLFIQRNPNDYIVSVPHRE